MTKWIFTFLTGMILLACNPSPSAENDGAASNEQDDDIYLAALGFEPGWSLEIREAVNDEYNFKLQVNNGSERTNGMLKRMQNTDTKQVFMGMDAGNKTVQVVFDKQECIHPSGEEGDGAVTVTWKKKPGWVAVILTDMEINNVEWKARCAKLQECEEKLQSLKPEFSGEDEQTDTYFVVPKGRLKLREGNVENALIYYERADEAKARGSAGKLYPNPGAGLKDFLLKALGEKVVVRKKRRIYFVDNVKIHFDEVPCLGRFIEVEALNRDGKFSPEHLQEQCDFYQGFFEIDFRDMEQQSYSDLLMQKNNSTDLNTNTL